MGRSLIPARANRGTTLMSTAAALLLILYAAALPLYAAPQGKGGAIKPAPTPAPAAKKTTAQPKRGATTTPRNARTSPATSNNSDAVEIAFWNSIKDSTDPEDFRAYLKKYPNGQFVDLANNRIRALEAAKAKPTATPAPAQQPTSTTAATASDAKVGQPANVTPPVVETKADAPSHFSRAEALKKSDRDAAEIEYRNAIRLDPGNAKYHNNLSYLLQTQCRNADAAAEMREAIRIEPTYDRYNSLSSYLEDDGKYEESLAALKEAGRLIKPGYAPWHGSLGRALARMGRWTEADAEFREAIRLGDPAQEHALYGRWGLASFKKYSEAEIELKEAIRLASQESVSRYHYMLGEILSLQKKWAEAEREYRESIRTYSSSLSPDTNYFYLAKALAGQGKLSEADAVFQEGMRSHPDDLGIREWYGTWLNDQKRFADAEAVFRDVISRTKFQSPLLYADLGDALKGEGKFAEAETEYRKALHIDGYNLRARFGLPGALEQQNRVKEAEAEFRMLVKAYCSWASPHGDFGDFLGRQKRWKEAEAEYREAMRLSPDNTEYPQKLQAAIDAQKKK